VSPVRLLLTQGAHFLYAFTHMMVVQQLDNLSLWSNPARLWSYAVAMGLQLLALYTSLRHLFGVVPPDWIGCAHFSLVAAAWGHF
jgi:hypothetical protein